MLAGMTERRPGPTPADRRARRAVGALFFTNGALYANLIPRYPEIKDHLGLDNVAYGFAVAAFPLGAIVAGLGAAALIRRFGSARVAVAGTILTGLAIFGAGLAPTVALLAVALFVGGAMDAFTDVGQNAHGLRVQRNYSRSIINSFHALWSIGAVSGGLMAAAAITSGVPLGYHLAIVAVVFSAVALVALRYCLPGRSAEPVRAPGRPPGRVEGRRPSARLVLTITALVLIAIAGTTIEDAGYSWATLYLSGTLGAPAAIAPAGYVALVGGQFLGRLVGDRTVDRFGQRAVARSGGAVAAIGLGLALAFPSIPGTILGFAAAGLGVATLVPAAMHEADELPGLRRGTGLTLVSWLMRVGFLFSPPLVGLIADTAGLRFGLLVVPVAGVAVVLLARVLADHRANLRPGAGLATQSGA